MVENKNVLTPANGASLYPQQNAFRDFRDLSGLWKMRIDWDDCGQTENWQNQPIPADEALIVPVPSSYNDLYADTSVRDHVGCVWYETEITIPASWSGLALQLRFDSVAHHATIWLDGQELGSHKGGFLPFAFDVSGFVKPGSSYRLTICADNRLDWTCLPAGELTERPDGANPGKMKRVQITHFDFINYTGIHRPVRLIALPQKHLTSIRVSTAKLSNHWKIIVESDGRMRCRLLDPDGQEVAVSNAGSFEVENPQLWEPGKGILYTAEVSLLDDDANVVDQYSEQFGFRTLEVRPDAFLINGQPFQFQGFGKHEDTETHGRGLDLAHLVHDFSLLKWIGANSVRTSHYPYSEEFMRVADQQGLVVIDEMPCVGFNDFQGTQMFGGDKANQKTLDHHLDVGRDLIARDGNHPCVVMWSLGNEPASQEDGARDYFKAVSEETRQLDPTRPQTIVEDRFPDQTQASQFIDVICINRYIGWYCHTAQYDTIEPLLEEDLRGWHERFNKPVIVAEYGADTVAGLHSATDEFFTEEYQITTLERYHRVFDKLPFVIGEHVWNFADFATKQGLSRVQGNKKGIFTRQRHPKSAAHYLRKRWQKG